MSHSIYISELFNPDEFENAVNKSCELIQDKFPNVDYIACSGISGITIAGAICYKLGKHIFINRKKTDDSHAMINKKQQNEFLEIDTGKINTAVIIDDLISSGDTAKRINNALSDNEILTIGMILYHETAYNGDPFGNTEAGLDFPIHSTNKDID